MIYSGIVITAVNSALLDENNQENLVCKIQDKLCIFCSGELVENVKSVRENMILNLKTLLLFHTMKAIQKLNTCMVTELQVFLMMMLPHVANNY